MLGHRKFGLGDWKNEEYCILDGSFADAVKLDLDFKAFFLSIIHN